MALREWRWPEDDQLTFLVREAQCNQAGALDKLLTGIRPALVAFFAARVPDDAAEDLAQNALIRISGAVSRIDSTRSGVYIRTVARNLLRSAHKRRSTELRRRADVSPGIADTTLGIPDSIVEYEELVRAVHRVAQAKLAPPIADIVVGLLRGETPPEIADRQGVSPVTVRTRLHRARAVLRRELSDCLHARIRRGHR